MTPDYFTDEWSVERARIAANRFLAHAPRVAWQGGFYPHDHWIAVAWQRIDKAARRGELPADPAGGEKLANLIGWRGCVEHLRNETGVRLRHRVKFVSWPLNDDGAELDLAAEDRPPHDRFRRLEVWTETRDRRAGLTMQQRIRLYLWLVEDWRLKDIAAVFGVTDSAVSFGMDRIMEALGYAGGRKVTDFTF